MASVVIAIDNCIRPNSPVELLREHGFCASLLTTEPSNNAQEQLNQRWIEDQFYLPFD